MMYSEDQTLTSATRVKLYDSTPTSTVSESRTVCPETPSRLAHVDGKLLLQIAIFNIGSHYNQHVLSGLSSEILSTFQVNRFAFGALFSSEEAATVVLCMAGIALVYTPLAPTAFFLTVTVLISTILTVLAVDPFASYSLLIVSRFVFGFTQGLLTTVQGAILAEQFPHRVGTAFGVMLLTSRISSFAGLTLPAMFAASLGLKTSLWIAVCTAVVPVLSAFHFLITSGNRRSMYPRRRSLSVSSFSPMADDSVGCTATTTTTTTTEEDKKTHMGMLCSKDEKKKQPGGGKLRLDMAESGATVGKTEQQEQAHQQQQQQRPLLTAWKIFLTDMRNAFPLAFWLCCMLWIMFSGVVYTILHFSVDILSPHFDISHSVASLFSSTLMLIAGLSSPFIGTIQDKLRNRPRVLFHCCVTLLCGCVMFILGLVQSQYQSLSKVSTTLAFALFALGFAVGPVTLMACVALIVPAHAMPAALAMYKATESAGLAVLHLTFGSLRDWTSKYFLSLTMLAALSVCGMLVSSMLRKHMPAYSKSHDTLSINVSSAT